MQLQFEWFQQAEGLRLSSGFRKSFAAAEIQIVRIESK